MSDVFKPQADGLITRIVVVHFGDLAPTLAAVERWVDWAPVVVVANDGTERPHLPRGVDWIVAPRNLGYGAGFNLAAGEFPADAFVLLNTDIVISESVFRGLLQRLWAERDVAVVAPTIVFPAGDFQSAVGILTGSARHPRVRPAQGSEQEAEWVTGAVMVIRGEFARSVPFSEGYFLGCEDVDLCIRASRDGWRVICMAGEPVVHARSHVIGGMWAYYSPRNEVWMARAHYGWWAGTMAWLYFLRRTPRTVVVDVLRRRGFGRTRLHVRGLSDALRPLPNEPLPDEPRPLRGQA